MRILILHGLGYLVVDKALLVGLHFLEVVDEVIGGVTYGKFTSDRIVCGVCADGSEPNAIHTACNECPSGTAGRNGVCERCSVGQQPSTDRSECLNCNDPNEFDQTAHGWASAAGEACEPCDAGRAPDANHDNCMICPPGKFSSDGVSCLFCPPGEEPSTIAFGVGATHCVECINGTHRHNTDDDGSGVMQSCDTCQPGQQPNSEQHACEECPAGRFSTDGGMCIRCNAGSAPNVEKTDCESGVGTYSAQGESCETCAAGSQPNAALKPQRVWNVQL